MIFFYLPIFASIREQEEQGCSVTTGISIGFEIKIEEEDPSTVWNGQ